VLLLAAVLLWKVAWYASITAAGGSALAGFEALRGWCILRACGVRTKL
jgi:hypothetical protein